MREAGDTTTSTTPATVPANAGGITRDQVLELLAKQTRVAAQDWQLRELTNLSSWAIANVYTHQLSEQMNEDTGVAALFRERGNTWSFAGWVSEPTNRVIELTNLGAPANVWHHFGLDPALPTGRAYPPEQMPADFGFVAEYGVEARNRFDSFEHQFTKDLGPTEDRPSTQLVLPTEVLESLYRDLVMIETQWHVFSTEFAPDPDPGNTGTSVHVTPFQTYRIEWSAGGFEAKPITWEDHSLSQAPEAVALRAWFKKLQEAIEATPAWKALPPMRGGYE